MGRMRSANGRAIKIALFIVCVFAIRGIYQGYDNRHIKVVHSSYMLNGVHPLVHKRYLELREVFYANKHSKDELVKALLKHGALIDLDIINLKENGYGGGFDHRVPQANGIQFAMPDQGAVVVRLSDWESSEWKAELDLALPFASWSGFPGPLVSYALSRMPF